MVTLNSVIQNPFKNQILDFEGLSLLNFKQGFKEIIGIFSFISVIPTEKQIGGKSWV